MSEFDLGTIFHSVLKYIFLCLILDSRASSHISNDRDKFSQSDSQLSIAKFLTIDSTKMLTVGAGYIKLSGNKTISDVLYVPSVTRNLLSVGKLKDQGHSVLFNPKHCYIFNNENPYRLHLRGTHDPRNN